MLTFLVKIKKILYFSVFQYKYSILVHIMSTILYLSYIDSVKTEVSLAVHRVGPTLLLDYLDVPALISYASQVG